MLVRKRNTRDRRVIQVYLTEKAWEIKDNLMKMQKEAGMNITGNFSDQDIKTLEELLHKVLVRQQQPPPLGGGGALGRVGIRQPAVLRKIVTSFRPSEW